MAWQAGDLVCQFSSFIPTFSQFLENICSLIFVRSMVIKRWANLSIITLLRNSLKISAPNLVGYQVCNKTFFKKNPQYPRKGKIVLRICLFIQKIHSAASYLVCLYICTHTTNYVCMYMRRPKNFFGGTTFFFVSLLYMRLMLHSNGCMSR